MNDLNIALQESEPDLMKRKPFYATELGNAYAGDALELIKDIPDESIDLIMTSPPYGLRKKKEYSNVDPEAYIEWFMPFANEFHRVLKQRGSFVLNIGGGWEKGLPVRSLYQFQLLLELCKTFKLAEEFVWNKPASLPTPAEWVTIRRIRVKDSIEYVWWLSKDPFPKANNKNVLKQYSTSMKTLLEKGYKAKMRPSGHKISEKFQIDNKGAIASNFLSFSNTESNSKYIVKCKENNIKPHPARFPLGLPDFFIRFLTDPGDVVLDPFAGSNVTGEAAEKRGRKWIAFEKNENYLLGSKFRFDLEQKRIPEAK
ncbi:MAG: site-specific DNA-methyltransferase [Thermoplasmatales archaeon]